MNQVLLFDAIREIPANNCINFTSLETRVHVL